MHYTFSFPIILVGNFVYLPQNLDYLTFVKMEEKKSVAKQLEQEKEKMAEELQAKFQAEKDEITKMLEVKYKEQSSLPPAPNLNNTHVQKSDKILKIFHNKLFFTFGVAVILFIT